MTTLSEVAADVAAALGLQHYPAADGLPSHWHDTWMLSEDGSELTNPYWRCRCEDWLHEHGWLHLEFGTPWPEAPARLVSAVWRKMKETT